MIGATQEVSIVDGLGVPQTGLVSACITMSEPRSGILAIGCVHQLHTAFIATQP